VTDSSRIRVAHPVTERFTSFGGTAMSETEQNQPEAQPWSDPSGGDAEHPGSQDELPLRMCRKCSTETRTTAPRCPMCGAPYVHGVRRLSHRARIGIVVGSAVLVLGGAGAAAALKINHDNAVNAQHKRQQQSAQVKRRAAEAEREAAQRQKPSTERVILGMWPALFARSTVGASSGLAPGPT